MIWVSKRRLKIIGFIVGLFVLFLILQYDFAEDDSLEMHGIFHCREKSSYLILAMAVQMAELERVKTLEKDIALDISLKGQGLPAKQGALVIMTRETDTDLADSDTRGYSRRKVEDLKNRLKMINNADNDFFVSIHLNAIPSPRWSGAQTFYAPHFKENAKAAKFIQEELRKI